MKMQNPISDLLDIHNNPCQQTVPSFEQWVASLEQTPYTSSTDYGLSGNGSHHIPQKNELFVRNIPRNISKDDLYAICNRFGKVLEVHVPVDIYQKSHGYAYVKYENESDASCGLELLNLYYITPGTKLKVVQPYANRRLYISNIPKYVSITEVQANLLMVFPQCQQIFVRNMQTDYVSSGNKENISQQMTANRELQHVGNIGNSGDAIVCFVSHLDALKVMDKLPFGVVKIWNQDVKVSWANVKRNMEPFPKTLFIRNIDLTLNPADIIQALANYVPNAYITKVSRVRTTAFVDFISHEAAMTSLNLLQGARIRGENITAEWAKPSEKDSLHSMRYTDFDATLRMICIANNWKIPIILFGVTYKTHALQYCAVVLHNDNTQICLICIMHTQYLVDIHSRLCEAICAVIETVNGFPDQSYVLYVEKNAAHLLGHVTYMNKEKIFKAASDQPIEFEIDINEIFDLNSAAIVLKNINEDELIEMYKASFRSNSLQTYLENIVVDGVRIFGTVLPGYRNQPPLKYKLNNMQIVLVLCFKDTGTNSPHPNRPYCPISVDVFNKEKSFLKYGSIKLLPLAVTQSRYAVKHNYKFLLFDVNDYYSSIQKINTPQMFIKNDEYNKFVRYEQAQNNTILQPLIQQPIQTLLSQQENISEQATTNKAQLLRIQQSSIEDQCMRLQPAMTSDQLLPQNQLFVDNITMNPDQRMSTITSELRTQQPTTQQALRADQPQNQFINTEERTFAEVLTQMSTISLELPSKQPTIPQFRNF